VQPSGDKSAGQKAMDTGSSGNDKGMYVDHPPFTLSLSTADMTFHSMDKAKDTLGMGNK
jgi:hypothetical protein